MLQVARTGVLRAGMRDPARHRQAGCERRIPFRAEIDIQPGDAGRLVAIKLALRGGRQHGVEQHGAGHHAPAFDGFADDGCFQSPVALFAKQAVDHAGGVELAIGLLDLEDADGGQVVARIDLYARLVLAAFKGRENFAGVSGHVGRHRALVQPALVVGRFHAVAFAGTRRPSFVGNPLPPKIDG